MKPSKARTDESLSCSPSVRSLRRALVDKQILSQCLLAKSHFVHSRSPVYYHHCIMLSILLVQLTRVERWDPSQRPMQGKPPSLVSGPRVSSRVLYRLAHSRTPQRISVDKWAQRYLAKSRSQIVRERETLDVTSVTFFNPPAALAACVDRWRPYVGGT